jgi:hypothetical protein
MTDGVHPILVGFRERYLGGTPFKQDRDRVDELMLEARPVVEALRFALASDAAGDLSRAEHREGLALVTLLGRRAGTLMITPTAAANLVPALAGGFEEAGEAMPASLVAPLIALCFEGYVAARDDAADGVIRKRVIDSFGIVEVAPRVLALALAGEQEPEILAEAVDVFGRVLFERDARAAIVDIGRLQAPRADRAAEVFAAQQAAQMLGATIVFVDPHDRWREVAARGRVDLDLVTVVPTFHAALAIALPSSDLALRPLPLRTRLWRWLRRRA